jgi:hypothetical protein
VRVKINFFKKTNAAECIKLIELSCQLHFMTSIRFAHCGQHSNQPRNLRMLSVETSKKLNYYRKRAG